MAKVLTQTDALRVIELTREAHEISKVINNKYLAAYEFIQSKGLASEFEIYFTRRELLNRKRN